MYKVFKSCIHLMLTILCFWTFCVVTIHFVAKCIQCLTSNNNRLKDESLPHSCPNDGTLSNQNLDWSVSFTYSDKLSPSNVFGISLRVYCGWISVCYFLPIWQYSSKLYVSSMILNNVKILEDSVSLSALFKCHDTFSIFRYFIAYRSLIAEL